MHARTLTWRRNAQVPEPKSDREAVAETWMRWTKVRTAVVEIGIARRKLEASKTDSATERYRTLLEDNPTSG